MKKKTQFIVPRAAGQASKPPQKRVCSLISYRLVSAMRHRPILTGIISIQREIMHRTAFV